MSFLLEKSKENILAAELLSTSSYKKPMVHCAYYGTFQRICHYLIKSYSLDYIEIKKIYFRSSQQSPGHHQAFRRAFEDKLRLQTKSRREFNQIANDFNKLKNWREQVDYHNNEVEKEMSDIAYNIAKELIKKIDKIYYGK